jgi:membrane protease YdiL (CAAX protease family)
VVLPAAWWLVRANETMGGHYRHLFGPALPAYVFLDLFGWEFMFRGWMVFGYTRQFGPQGIWLHCSLFALAHLGKPAIETFTTVAGGLAFGWIAYRTRSFLYPFLIHWALMTLVVMAAQTAAG